ncbi:MAG: hypothetical protein AAFQ64_17020 [Pseudomonadota bacterium]
MMSEADVVTILEDESTPCSIELELFDAIGKTPHEVSQVTGRVFEVESLILPNMEGGSPIISQIVRFKPKGST